MGRAFERRGGRVVEGGTLLRCYTGNPRIEGSNPSLSAIPVPTRSDEVADERASGVEASLLAETPNACSSGPKDLVGTAMTGMPRGERRDGAACAHPALYEQSSSISKRASWIAQQASQTCRRSALSIRPIR